MEVYGLILGAVGLALGGILKGATGAGAPVIAVPILAMVYDVPMAVALFSIPNVVSNAWQGWQFRAHHLSRRFALTFALAGGVGAAIGTVMLAKLPAEALLLTVAFAAIAFVAFRVTKPDWALSRAWGDRLVGPAGLVGGVLQGAVGVSAPVSITFLNSMKLERPQFIATISVFFATMAVPQIPMLVSYGFLDWNRAGLSVLATGILFATMPLGTWLARHISRVTFDRIILVLLLGIALRLIASVLFF